jgi:sugar/nucleoside kinase (ribokinase family)
MFVAKIGDDLFGQETLQRMKKEGIKILNNILRENQFN